MADGDRAIADRHVADRPSAISNAVDPVRMVAAAFVQMDVVGRQFYGLQRVGPRFQVPAVDFDLALGAREQDPVTAAVVHGDSVGVAVGQCFLFGQVWRDDLDRAGAVHAEPPLGDVEVVGPPVGHQSAGGVAHAAPATAVIAANPFAVVGMPGAGAKPTIPVNSLRHGFRRELFVRTGTTDADVDLLDVANVAVAYQFAGETEIPGRALLTAGLKDPAVSPSGVDHLTAFANGQAERFFAIDVFAGPHGQDGHGRVPMIRRRDQDSVDIITSQQVAEVVVQFDAAVLPAFERGTRFIVGIPFLNGLFAPFRSLGLHIADRENLEVGIARQVAQMPTSHVADPDEAQPNAVVRSRPARCQDVWRNDVGRCKRHARSLQAATKESSPRQFLCLCHTLVSYTGKRHGTISCKNTERHSQRQMAREVRIEIKCLAPCGSMACPYPHLRRPVGQSRGTGMARRQAVDRRLASDGDLRGRCGRKAHETDAETETAACSDLSPPTTGTL